MKQDLVADLINALTILPGVGKKSAQRMALYLLDRNKDGASILANTLSDALDNIQRCESCRMLTSNNLCKICLDTARDIKKICVVEDIADQWSIQSSNIFHGYFHILGGTISSVGQRKEDLLINSLINRVNKEEIDEVILACSNTVEGQTTAYYIKDSLKNSNVKVTKLAQGLPVGGEIESLDDGTLFSAFKNRSNLSSNSD